MALPPRARRTQGNGKTSLARRAKSKRATGVPSVAQGAGRRHAGVRFISTRCPRKQLIHVIRRSPEQLRVDGEDKRIVVGPGPLSFASWTDNPKANRRSRFSALGGNQVHSFALAPIQHQRVPSLPPASRSFRTRFP